MTVSTQAPPAPTWDLESIFPGGSSSSEYKKFREKVDQDLTQLEKEVTGLPEQISKGNVAACAAFVGKIQELLDRIIAIEAFAGCLTAQNVKDDPAHAATSEADLYVARWQKIRTEFEAVALRQNDEQWSLLIEQTDVKPVAFYLNEMRRMAKSKMPRELETLALDLSVNGLHAWNRLYDKMAGDLTVDFEDNGSSKTISLGQNATKLSDPRREIRHEAFKNMVSAWESRADLASMTLNAISGFRLSLYKRRGWDSYMYEPLQVSRLKEESLNAMWQVIESQVPRLQKYLDAKKKLLKIDNFSWWDEFAPCGKADRVIPFDEAGQFVVDNVRPFSEDLAKFCQMALENRWVEAEDRPNKAGGGFCTGFGPFKQSRIFMTYGGTFENLLTLAHELGHAYHGFVLKDRPPFAKRYPMTLAETASIFAETIVTDAALKQSDDPQEKLMLLDQKLQQPYILFCDIYSRYLFERSLYEERQKGTVQRNRMSELMVAAQKRAYANMLDDNGYHPLFWCSKLHFYISELPFYNFPYTFGYLFAGGVYDRAQKEGAGFADKYRELLADTGSMSTDDVAKKHLGIDLTGDQFWTDAVNRSLADIDEFVRLADELA
jgi:pepF/M3 family oligoendopeptidase